MTPIVYTALAGVVASAIAWGAGAWWGYGQSETKHQAAIMSQALEANANMRKANENAARVERQLVMIQASLGEKETEYAKIKERYAKVNEEKFRIGRELERAIDEFSRVHNAPTNSMPSPTESAGGAAELQETVLTSAALLSAYGNCTKELDKLYDAKYAPLVDFELTARKIALEGAGFSPDEAVP